MTPLAFRKIALAQEGASEGRHVGHPDFRAGGKIFASLGFPNEASGMVKLTPEQQEILVAAEPAIFAPFNGLWGQRGYTRVHLPAADARTMKSALAMACRNAPAKSAPKSAPSKRGAARPKEKT